MMDILSDKNNMHLLACVSMTCITFLINQYKHQLPGNVYGYLQPAAIFISVFCLISYAYVRTGVVGACVLPTAMTFLLKRSLSTMKEQQAAKEAELKKETETDTKAPETKMECDHAKDENKPAEAEQTEEKKDK